MDVHVEGKELSALLSPLAKIATDKFKPILGFAKINAADGKVSLFGTDLNRNLTLGCDADVVKPGESLVNPSLLSRFLVGNDGSLRLTVEKDKLIARTEKATATLDTASVSEYPSEPKPLPASTECIGSRLKLLADIAFGTDAAETRYAMSGIQLKQKDGALWAVATDSRACCLGELCKSDVEWDCLIPSADAVAAASLFEQHESVSLAASSNAIEFSANGMRMQSRLLDGRFPDVFRAESGFDEKKVGGFNIPKQTLLATATRSAGFTGENTMGVNLSVKSGELSVESGTPEKGRFREAIPISGNFEFETRIASDYLRNAIRSFRSEDIQVEFFTDNAKEGGPVRLSTESHRIFIMHMAKD